MPPPDAISVDGEAGDWNDEPESSVVGDSRTGRKSRYNYAKCATCRERKKKVRAQQLACAILGFADIPDSPPSVSPSIGYGQRNAIAAVPWASVAQNLKTLEED